MLIHAYIKRFILKPFIILAVLFRIVHLFDLHFKLIIFWPWQRVLSCTFRLFIIHEKWSSDQFLIIMTVLLNRAAFLCAFLIPGLHLWIPYTLFFFFRRFIIYCSEIWFRGITHCKINCIFKLSVFIFHLTLAFLLILIWICGCFLFFLFRFSRFNFCLLGYGLLLVIYGLKLFMGMMLFRYFLRCMIHSSEIYLQLRHELCLGWFSVHCLVIPSDMAFIFRRFGV